MKTRRWEHGLPAAPYRLNRSPEAAKSHEHFASCIKACCECATACEHCAVSCLQEPDPKAMARCIALDLDCASICRLAASFMARSSGFFKPACLLCAQICEECGLECTRHPMEHCQDCAEICRRCAQECRQMSQ